jgi:hypothetical protein
VVSKYPLDHHESKGLVEVLELVGRSPLPSRQSTEDGSHAVRRVARGGTERLCCRLVAEELLIRVHPAAIFLYNLADNKHYQLAPCAAAVNDTTAVLDSCSLTRGRGASSSVKEEEREHRTKAPTFASSLL